MSELVKIKGLTKSYDKRKNALDHLDLTEGKLQLMILRVWVVQHHFLNPLIMGKE